MNTIKFIGRHKTFETYFFEKFHFTYQNVLIRLEVQDKKLLVELEGEETNEKMLKIFCKLYDLLFLILGAFPQRECILINGIEEDTGKWVRKYDTAVCYDEKESRLCELSLQTIDGYVLSRMADVHHQTLSSVEFIVCEYYRHVVTNHRIELMTHTIDGFLRHTAFYSQLLQQIKNKNPKRWKVDYIESVEWLFKKFFYYHRKFNCQILGCMHIKNERRFYEMVADTRNDFSHFLEDKKYRLLQGSDMAYFIDLIFYAERLFIVTELLGLKVSEEQVKEYLYILHDWIDECVNQRSDRIKSKRYQEIMRAKEWNTFISVWDKHETI